MRFMRMAVRLARRSEGRTAPNPPVGAVVVRDGQVVGRGRHRRAGLPHAEVEALGRAGSAARGATLYVTLEPCNHWGRTPPCTEAILRAGIRRVVVGVEDPNPTVEGGGIQRLRREGLEVDVGVERRACARLIEGFSVFVREGRSHVTLKAALTLDGRIATRTGSSQWISGAESLRFAHRLRDVCDAVLVGAGTVRTDDPRLTCRIRGGRNPLRVVLTRSLDLPPDAKVFSPEPPGALLAVAGQPPRERLQTFRTRGIEVLSLPAGPGEAIRSLLQALAARNVMRLLVEGGSGVHGAFWDAQLVDRVAVVVAPKLVGGREAPGMIGGRGIPSMSDAVELEDLEIRRLGRDVLIQGRPRWPGWLREA